MVRRGCEEAQDALDPRDPRGPRRPGDSCSPRAGAARSRARGARVAPAARPRSLPEPVAEVLETHDHKRVRGAPPAAGRVEYGDNQQPVAGVRMCGQLLGGVLAAAHLPVPLYQLEMAWAEGPTTALAIAAPLLGAVTFTVVALIGMRRIRMSRKGAIAPAR